MNARTIRRAAERKARKLALKSAKEQEPFHQSQPTLLERSSQSPVSAARLEANRANAALSTGPKSQAGRKRSSLNAVKTALTGRTVLLPSDDVERYQALVANWEAELKPEGPRESALVQSIADSYWRAERILCLEYAFYAEGRERFADEFSHLGASEAAARIDAKTFLAYEKQLRNLGIQEARLRRQREKDLHELQTLQNERRAEQAEASAQQQNKQETGTAKANGFVFATQKTAASTPSPTPQSQDREEQSLRQVA